ncbi:Susd and RagB outer membrane lipoprotein [Mariniflexile rhizosphaerae]|uniref:SusD/RagB family nutrient-binding outer membrane lipoprotein n=1 Tax=unclassified Mariniflexile TaxID=2643887 RepID=UPI000CBACA88|nr:SusD/RagB family nutrient-binding outer membrane lipoprotein [Mariniflexile sp. TRM1-10]AXP81469.1 Susd and RagB outer membrane lipoprotein [Mariniflexile sp. TRM1-10]PLB18319.1 MAG: RagB/SusD domain protein [Flavobacteriaceae bacterium FS1-H7996/R]
MKNYIIKFFTIVFLFQITGCTSDFDEVNTDPNSLTTDQLDATLAGPAFANALYKGIGNASWSLPGDDYGTYGLATALHSMLFAHYMTPGWAAATDANGINDGWRSRGWLRFYTLAVPSLLNTYKAAEGNAEATAILDIWKVYMFHRFTDHWGPIPYSEAGIGGSSVAYDSQESMYTDFFNLLEAANATLSAASESTVGIFRDYDAIYSGDVEKWRKFGNSLRLRLALRISDVDASEAQSQAEAAVSAGVMQSNDDNAYYAVTPDTYNNFVDIMKFWGFYMTADMESILKGYDDPRMSIWFAPVSGEDSPYLGDYVGLPNGGGALLDRDGNNLSLTNQETTFADNSTKDIEVMMASESNFNRAEGALKGWNMSGTAQTLYEDGVRLSMEQWGVGSTDVDTYLAGATTGAVPTFGDLYEDSTPPVDVPVAWAATEGEQLKQIAVQKYLGLFPESWEAWSDLRRTDADILYPLLTTEDPTIGFGVIKRVTYLPNEYATNEAAVLDAVTTLGGPDKGNTNLWWDVN